MNKAFLVLFLMILGHLIADYPLQGWLAQAKAKSFWENSPKKNKHDYIPALICHGLMWSIIISLPIMYYNWQNLNEFWLFIPVNAIIHCSVDHSKANHKTFNLWQDQLFHLAQIVYTWIVWAISFRVF